MAKRSAEVVEIDGKRLTLSNLDKVMYPATGFTKAHVIDYYVRIAPVLLPHLRGRPLTLKRYPQGVQGFFFYEKNCPSRRPSWLATTRVWSKGKRRWMDYCLVQDVPSLVWLANLADLELHTSLSLGDNISVPTMMVFDLDPGSPATIRQCCQVGLWLREFFEPRGITTFPKTSGGKGLQVYVPLNKTVGYDETKSFAHALARKLERDHPELVISEMKKSLRPGKVFVDWSQNDQHKTTVCAYSLRARELPTVSCPVTWKEVEGYLKGKDQDALVFDSSRAILRAGELGDLFAPVLTLKQKLPALESIDAVVQPKASAKKAATRTSSKARRRA